MSARAVKQARTRALEESAGGDVVLRRDRLASPPPPPPPPSEQGIVRVETVAKLEAERILRGEAMSGRRERRRKMVPAVELKKKTIYEEIGLAGRVSQTGSRW